MGPSLFIVAGELLAAAVGSTDQKWLLGVLHGEHRVLATGPAG